MLVFFLSVTNDLARSLKSQEPFSERAFCSHAKPTMVPTGMIVGIAFKRVDILPMLKDDLLSPLLPIPKVEWNAGESVLRVINDSMADEAKIGE
ncbi:hypothetical protein KSX_85620 [Ktedonospora formicarum]|uniref:Uncharacterized protein n=2 Tax=Ktedonospora formicarum TaxID=2778364 RepID=A0A8J3I6C5_9CHLR|nr:hypothetical protein KSX_85620 [Ktedonospora formicarum]